MKKTFKTVIEGIEYKGRKYERYVTSLGHIVWWDITKNPKELSADESDKMEDLYSNIEEEEDSKAKLLLSSYIK